MLHVTPILFLAVTLASQQGAKPSTSPTRIDLGVVRVGAIAESTVHIYWESPMSGNRVVAKLPRNTRQLTLTSDTDENGHAETRLGFAIATDQLGKHETSIGLQLGGRQTSVALTWTVEPAVVRGSRILVATSPFMGDSSSDPTVFDPWRALVEQAAFDVDYRYRRKDAPPFTADALARVDIVVVGEDGLIGISDAEAARLQGFVCGGGRVVVFANAFFFGTTKAANLLCKPFGLSMMDREPPIGPAHVAIDEDLPRHPLTVGVKKVVVRRPSPTIVDDPKKATALVVLPALGAELPFAAIATTKSGGELITIGESLWWNWIGKSAGNQRLMRNLLVRAPRLR